MRGQAIFPQAVGELIRNALPSRLREGLGVGQRQKPQIASAASSSPALR